MNIRPRHQVLMLLAGSVLVATAWASLAPIHTQSNEAVFEIPKGTWARRMAGARLEILPSEMHLTLGLRDVLVLRNLDDVPQVFGPTLLMPGQTLRLPFEVASRYTFACTAHLSGQMTIVVEPRPESPVARLRWRVNEWMATAPWRSGKTSR